MLFTAPLLATFWQRDCRSSPVGQEAEHSFLLSMQKVPRAAASLWDKLLCENLAFNSQKETLRGVLLQAQQNALMKQVC